MKLLFLKNFAHPKLAAAAVAGSVHEVPDEFAQALVKSGDAKLHVDAKSAIAGVESFAAVLTDFAERLQKAEATIATLSKVLADLGVHDHSPEPVAPPASAPPAEPTAGPFAS